MTLKGKMAVATFSRRDGLRSPDLHNFFISLVVACLIFFFQFNSDFLSLFKISIFYLIV